MLYIKKTGTAAPFIVQVPMIDSTDGTLVFDDGWYRLWNICISSTSNDMFMHLIANNAGNYEKHKMK